MNTNLSRYHLLPGMLLLALAGSPAGAAPNVFWDHLEMKVGDVAACVAKAESAMHDTDAGRITKDAESVRAWSEQSYAVIECLDLDGKILAMVLVAGEDCGACSGLHANLKSRMQQ